MRTPLFALLTSHAISLTGNMMTVIALPLYVLAKTGSPAATGLAGAFATAPIVLGGAFGGVLVDRIGYRPASILADLVSCLTIAAVPLLDASTGLPFWALLALVFVSGLPDTPGHARAGGHTGGHATAAMISAVPTARSTTPQNSDQGRFTTRSIRKW